MSEFDIDYTKDNRRNSRKEATANHFKDGKKIARCHKDVLRDEKKTCTEESEISHLGFKVRQALKTETLKIINDQRDSEVGNETVDKNYAFGTSYIDETIVYNHKNTINIIIPKPIHEDGPNVDFQNINLLSFISEIEEEDYEKYLILNYMYPTSPVNNFNKDSSLYEESLALSSCLYRSLTEGKDVSSVYKKNTDLDDGIYTSDLIYSPNLPFFRDEDLDLIDDWKVNYSTINVISIPSVNYKKFSESEEKYEKIMRNRINRIFRVAIKHNHTKLVLGPWGCGLDGGPLDKIIKWFSEDELSDTFDEIYFICNDDETLQIMQDNF
jgi:uncharacterized protein (TIGR02452 family)